jgi:DNA-directed RNA polymerase subunit RPC12/RpoP
MGQVIEFGPRPKKAPPAKSDEVLPVLRCSLCSSTQFYLLDDAKGGIACVQCRHRTAAIWGQNVFPDEDPPV